MKTVLPWALSSRTARKQGGFADVVEVGVGLVQHQQGRLAVDGARQSDALALPPGQQAAGFAHRRVVAARQAQDHVVDAGARGRGDDLLASRPAPKRAMFSEMVPSRISMSCGR
jgi:hypothetical protein